MIPVLLTVEEAGELLRIGRTKAYAMAREWRETDRRVPWGGGLSGSAVGWVIGAILGEYDQVLTRR
jgi:hypothetical protein